MKLNNPIKKVLLVFESDDSFQDAILNVLRHRLADVDFVVAYPEALPCLEEKSIEVVVTDGVMPLMQIRARFPYAKVIVILADDEDSETARSLAMRYGADAVLSQNGILLQFEPIFRTLRIARRRSIVRSRRWSGS